MQVSRSVVLMLSVAMTAVSSCVAVGQSYPNKPIRMLTSQSGGGVDLLARLIGPGISRSLGQRVVIDNRGGGGGIIAAEIVAKARPDGYTLLCWGPAIWLSPLLQNDVPYDPVKDFSPIIAAVSTPNIVVVHPSLPVKSVKELIALAKARPKQLNYGSGGNGASTHLAGELFKVMAGVNIVRINYRGVGPALTDLIAGQVQVMFPTAGAAVPHIKTGRVRALAVTSARPSALAPGLPTVAASGVPGYESVAIFGIFAPAGTPRALINLLNQEAAKALSDPDVKKRLFNAGEEIVGGSPEEFAAFVKSDMAKWGKLINDANIKEE